MNKKKDTVYLLKTKDYQPFMACLDSKAAKLAMKRRKDLIVSHMPVWSYKDIKETLT